MMSKLMPTSNRVDGLMASELDKFNITLTWKIDDAMVAQLASCRSKKAESTENNKTSNNETKGVSFNQDITTVENAPATSGGVTESGTNTFGYDTADFGGGEDEKPCGACTFLNPMGATRCSCCDTAF